MKILPPTPGFFSFFFKATLQTHAPKISADVDGGLSGVSRCADTGARTPIGVSGNFGPSVDDQAVSLSDDGTTIIIDFFSFLFLFSFLFFSLSPPSLFFQKGLS